MTWWNSVTSTAAADNVVVTAGDSTQPVTQVNEHLAVINARAALAAAEREAARTQAEFVALDRIVNPPTYVAEEYVPQAGKGAYIRADAGLDEARKRRNLAHADLLDAQDAERAAMEQARREVRELYVARCRPALAALNAVLDEAIQRNDEVYAIWKAAKQAGAPLGSDVYCPYILTDESPGASWVLNWRRILRAEGWL